MDIGKSSGYPLSVKRTRKHDLILTLALLALIYWLWDAWPLRPYRLFVVFLHEFSHAFMAWATGGQVISMNVVAQEGGVCVTSGGSRFLTLSAGYLGSLLCGGALLLLAARRRGQGLVTAVVGGLTLAVTCWLVRPILGVGFLFGIGMGGALCAAGKFLDDDLNEILLRIIGLTSCFYVALDIKSDTLDRPRAHSDAWMLAHEFFGPTWFWGGLWFLAAIILSGWFLRRSLERK